MFYGRDHIPQEQQLRAVVDRTYRAECTYEAYIRRALMARDDEKIAERLTEQLCKVCYYLERGALYGQAFTSADCRFCRKEIIFSSTRTDDLCPDCAKKHSLCRHCMADIELRERRKL